MCTEIYKKMQTKQIYSEIAMLLRTSGIPTDKIGTELIKYAILAYLHEPNKEFEDIITTAIENVPAAIHGIDSKDTEEAFLVMKETLESVNTKHIEKVDDDNVVEKFVKNIADEVKMTELMKYRVEVFQMDVSFEQRNIFIQTALRKSRKPKDDFKKEVLSWVAGKYGYDNIIILLKDLYSITAAATAHNRKDIEESFARLEKMKENTTWTKEERTENKKFLNSVIAYIEKAIDDLIKGKDTLVF